MSQFSKQWCSAEWMSPLLLVFTGGYWSEAALVLLSSSSRCHCLSLVISPCALCLLSLFLTHLFTFFPPLLICGFSSSEHLHALPQAFLTWALPLLFLFCHFSPSSRPSFSPRESQDRNRTGCQLDERGHAGPVDRVSCWVIIKPRSTLPHLHMHISSRHSRISLPTHFSLCCVTLTSTWFLRTVRERALSCQSAAKL